MRPTQKAKPKFDQQAEITRAYEIVKTMSLMAAYGGLSATHDLGTRRCAARLMEARMRLGRVLGKTLPAGAEAAYPPAKLDDVENRA